MDHDRPSEALLELARRYGVSTDYWDWQGRHVPVSTDTICHVLAALGVDVDADDDDAIRAAIQHADERHWRRTLPASVVVREGRVEWLPVHVPHGQPVELEIIFEDGTRRPAGQVDHWVDPRWVGGRQIGEATFELPADLPLGWHRLRAHGGGIRESDRTAEAALVVTPARLALESVADGRRLWGGAAQLYQVRSRRSWGIGDLGDLGTLTEWLGRDLGADFLLVNPLHAPQPVSPIEPSPYLPSTRRFSDPIYLVVEDIPEFAQLSGAARDRAEQAAEQARALNQLDTIDRDRVWALKRSVLAEVYALGLSAARSAAFEEYRRTAGRGLIDFATWCALQVEYPGPWQRWPEDLRRADSPQVAIFREEHFDEVGFYCWLQWQLDQQLAAAQRRAKAAGMALGIIKDLAVGVHPEGADSWSLADVLAQGATVGAPPDQFNQLGQNWHQPPWRPDRLAEAGYGPYRDLLRTVLKDSGGIRVDHVIGLFRLWWVPIGSTADAGAYVRYDYEALVGILALEAQRAGAFVIGEDLGVVEPMARDYLRERGILGTSILWFEWTGDGHPLPPEHYRELCLTAVTTHDLPPTAGYLNLEHVRIREELELLTRPVAEEREIEQAAVTGFVDLARDRGLLTSTPSHPGAPGSDSVRESDDRVVALHRLIALTPSRMLLAAVADLAGDRRAINQPGTMDEYPNWRLPLAGADGTLLLLEDLPAVPVARRIADALRD